MTNFSSKHKSYILHLMEQVHFYPYMGYPPILAQPPDVYQNVAFLDRTHYIHQNDLDIMSI